MPDESLIDAALSEDMDAVLRLVSLGGAARNAAKVNVRRPLAGLRVAAGSGPERRAVGRFAGLIADELNVKAVTPHPGTAGPLLTAVVKLNKKSAAAKLGPRLKEAEEAVGRMSGDAVVVQLRNGPVEVVGVPLAAADFLTEYRAADGWAGVADKGTQVAVDTRITPELRAEGLARDVVRLVQNARKDAGLDVADKIALFLAAEDAELRTAIDTHWPTIAADVQAVGRPDAPRADAHTAAVTIDGRPLTIALRKA